MDHPTKPALGTEALLFLSLVLLPYFTVSFLIQMFIFSSLLPRYVIPSLFEMIVAHGLAFVVSVVTIMVFMHYVDFFEPLLALVPLANIIVQLMFYHHPFRDHGRLAIAIIISNLCALGVATFVIYYYFDWIISAIF